MEQEENALVKIAKQLDVKLEIHQQDIETYKKALLWYKVNEKDVPFNKLYHWKMYKEFMVPSLNLLPTSLIVKSEISSEIVSPILNKGYGCFRNYNLEIKIGEEMSIKEKNLIHLRKNDQEQAINDWRLKKQLKRIINDSYSFLKKEYPKTFNFMLNPFPLIRKYNEK